MGHRRSSLPQFVLALLFIVPAACSVKADRTECPCYLTAAFDREFAGRISLTGWQNATCVLLEEAIAPNAGGEYVQGIPRGVYEFCAGVGYNVISLGNQSDSLYLWSSEGPVDATGEEVYLPLSMDKQFATHRLDMVRPCSVSVRGRVKGVDLFTLVPLGGDFRYEPVSDDGIHYQLRLPRQLPAPEGYEPLELLVLNGDAGPASVPLGWMIEESGYNWQAKSLSDLEIRVDYIAREVTIRVQEWGEGFTKRVEY